MQNLTKSLMMGSLLAAGAYADINIGIPAPATALATLYKVGADSTSAGALGIKALSGATYYIGHSCTAGLTETTLGELALKWSLAYDAADGAYGTSVGILLPITASWDIKDLSKATAIQFDIKAAAEVFGHLIIGSDIYPTVAATANAALKSADFDVTTDYTTQTIAASNLGLPEADWYKGTDLGTWLWLDPTGVKVSISKAVKSLNFQPTITWASATKITADAAVSNTFTIRNVSIKGVSPYTYTAGTHCGASFVTLDDFSSAKISPSTLLPRKAVDPNYLGGYWYAFTDTATGAVKNADTATGASNVVLPTGMLKWVPVLDAGAILTATLEKNNPNSTFLYHKYAGWADIGTDLPGNNVDGSLDLQNLPSGNALTAIGFDLYAGASLASLIPSATIDTVNIQRITLKVGKASVLDAQQYQVDIPVSQATGAANTNLCIDAAQLIQPSWYTSVHGVKAFTAEDLTKLTWEIKIEDQRQSTVHTSGPNTFAVTNIKLFGIVPADGIKGSAGHSTGALKVSYGSGLVLSYSVAGTSAQVDVVRLDGSKVASFTEAATAKNLSLPVSLTHGSYLVTVRGTSNRLVSSLAVAR